jgi:type IX secretion system PorP/SprF family membrane protein
MFKHITMKKIISHLLLVLAFIISGTATAQQNSLFNTYSLDPLQLNIAYAGASCTEANVHYRAQWIGMKETPKLIQLNAHTALGKSNALALRVNSQTQGLLNTMQATLGYAYRFRISETAKVHLGIGVGWTQAALNAQKAVVMDANDATLNNGNRQTANGFDSEFGAMVVGEKLKAGIAVQHLYNSSPDFSGSSTYKALPQFNTQVSYIFNKGKKVEIEPWLLDRYTLQGTNVVEGMLNFNFIKVITVGAGYRSNYGVMGLVGARLGNLKLAYSFDYGTSKNATNLGSSHQVMLGFSLCKTAKTPKPEEQTEPVVVTPTPTVIAPEPVKEEPVVTTPTVTPAPEPVKEQPVVVKEDILAMMNQVAEEVVFDLNKSKLDQEGLKKLDEIAALMKKDPELVINIVGHTCNLGTAELNSLLSVRRATYVRNQLVKRGANPKNIDRSKGVGADNALFDNNSEQQRKNRTVRFESAR